VVRKRSFLHFVQMISLPIQARDKHRGNSSKRNRFPRRNKHCPLEWYLALQRGYPVHRGLSAEAGLKIVEEQRSGTPTVPPIIAPGRNGKTAKYDWGAERDVDGAPGTKVVKKVDGKSGVLRVQKHRGAYSLVARLSSCKEGTECAEFAVLVFGPDSLIGSTQICLFSTFRRTKLWFTRMDAGQTIRNISKETGVWCGRSVNGL
jgi:hypothetical protein